MSLPLLNFKVSSVDVLFFLIFSVGTLILSIYVLGNTYVGVSVASTIAVSPLIMSFFFNFRLSVAFEILSLFIPIVVGLYSSVYFSYFLLFAFLLANRDLTFQDFETPLNKIFIFYLLSLVPSFIFSQDIGYSFYQSFNIISFFIVFYSLFVFLNRYKDYVLYLYIFLFFVLLNSVQIIILNIISGRRYFGFSGIMFVDYVGISIIITTVLFVFTNRKWKIILLPVLLCFCIALVFTQTRSIWIVTGLTLSFFFIYLVLKAKKLSIKRNKVISLIIFIITLFALLSYYLVTQNQQLLARIQNKPDTAQDIRSGEITSSLITRLFIWDTAINAFKQNIVFGTGIFTFPHVSDKYYKIPKFLYDKYVKSLTPHETFLAVASERGIVGLIVFIIFIIAIIGFTLKNVKLSTTSNQKRISVVLLFANLYIALSMVITDAWLWGHGIILWSIVLAFTASNRKIIIKENELNTKT